LLDAEGLHRLASSTSDHAIPIDAIGERCRIRWQRSIPTRRYGPQPDEPILSQDELRALLQEQPASLGKAAKAAAEQMDYGATRERANLVIGDSQRELQSAVLEALPGTTITSVPRSSMDWPNCL